MGFEMTITFGSIINILSLFITVLLVVYKFGRYNVAMESRMDRLEMLITNQSKEVIKLENATKLDVQRLESTYENCYVKVVVKEHENKIGDIEKQQVTLRAQLPLQLETIRKEIEVLGNEVKGLRSDIAHRRKENGEGQ